MLTSPNSGRPAPRAVSPASSTSETLGSTAKTIVPEEVSLLQTHLFHKEDSVFQTDFAKAPSYNMRTWAAGTRQAGGSTSSKAAKKMMQWDTSYVEEAQDEGTFLNFGPSVLTKRRRPSNIRSSRNTMATIRNFKPGAEGNKAVLEMLDRDSEEFVRSRVTKSNCVLAKEIDQGLPPTFGAHLSQDVLKPLVEQSQTEFKQRSGLFDPALKLEWKPKHRGNYAPIMHDCSSLLAPGVRAPPESLAAGVESPDGSVVAPQAAASPQVGGSHSVSHSPQPAQQNLLSSEPVPLVSVTSVNYTPSTNRNVGIMPLSVSNFGNSLSPTFSNKNNASFDVQSTSNNLRTPMHLPPVMSPASQIRHNAPTPSFAARAKRPMSPTRTQLPEHHNVDYVELHREQEIIREATEEQEEGYKEAKENLKVHMVRVKEAFDAMLRGSFYDVRAGPKGDQAGKPPTTTDTEQEQQLGGSTLLLPPTQRAGSAEPSPRDRLGGSASPGRPSSTMSTHLGSTQGSGGPGGPAGGGFVSKIKEKKRLVPIFEVSFKEHETEDE